jgi:catechol 2,3-dioxygenase-like lactoylglutathione lyase family enzyme
MEQELALRPFIPARDYELSRKFYQALGFAVTMEGDQVTILKLGSCSFLLQNFYVKELAENFVVQLMVRNLDLWWERMDAADLAEYFAAWPPRAPKMQPWGLKVGFFADPSGVLWHVAESVF